ncbi:hypothetical protein HZB78_05675, partial [Candidatus Collierbacteria bacterium]|nr:hypothetical protein [Candidatus Collierbacteria bacterium]
MPIYPSSGGFIGSLLRTIQEERSKAPHVLPPAAEPKAPVRAAVQAPLEAPIAPESPGSARVISIRPEGAPPTSAAVPAGKVIPPQSYAGGVGSGGISPIMREKFPEAFNGSEKSAVQNQFSVGTSGTPEAPTQKSAAAPSYEAQIAESGRKIAALDKQLEQLARFEPQPDAGAAERAKNSLIAANQR